MKQLTLRFDTELQRRLQKLARREGISLNKAAVQLLRQGAGLVEPEREANVVGDSLDHLFGAWSEDDERDFLAAIESLEQIDQSLWT